MHSPKECIHFNTSCNMLKRLGNIKHPTVVLINIQTSEVEWARAKKSFDLQVRSDQIADWNTSCITNMHTSEKAFLSTLSPNSGMNIKSFILSTSDSIMRPTLAQPVMHTKNRPELCLPAIKNVIIPKYFASWNTLNWYNNPKHKAPLLNN